MVIWVVTQSTNDSVDINLNLYLEEDEAKKQFQKLRTAALVSEDLWHLWVDEKTYCVLETAEGEKMEIIIYENVV